MKRHPSRDSGGNFGRGGHWIRTEKRQRIYDRDGRRCVYCGSDGNDSTGLTLDHVVPRPRGSNEVHNLVTACFSCNSAKADRSAIEFAFATFDKPWRVLNSIVEALERPLPERRKKECAA